MSNYSILIIDDEPNNFEVAEAFLAGEQYSIYYCSSGGEAIASIDVFQPDLILLDLIMPEMDGLTVCKQLKLMRQWRSVPIIMLTSLSEETTIEKCLQAGADDFIHKPVRGTELRARVRSMLRIKKQFDRIESFTKLQQNKINLLENDIVGLGADLAIWFVNELNAPLVNIIDCFEDLHRKIALPYHTNLTPIVTSGQESAMDLERLANKFWIYMELICEKQHRPTDASCNVKSVTEEIVAIKFQSLRQTYDLRLNVEGANLAITDQHCEWIIKELLDDVIQFSQPGKPVEISGWLSGRIFHLRFTNGNSPDLVVRSAEEQELSLSLKTVKKIVSIYDGQFSFSNTDLYDRTVHITLPM